MLHRHACQRNMHCVLGRCGPCRLSSGGLWRLAPICVPAMVAGQLQCALRRHGPSSCKEKENGSILHHLALMMVGGAQLHCTPEARQNCCKHCDGKLKQSDTELHCLPPGRWPFC